MLFSVVPMHGRGNMIRIVLELWRTYSVLARMFTLTTFVLATEGTAVNIWGTNSLYITPVMFNKLINWVLSKSTLPWKMLVEHPFHRNRLTSSLVLHCWVISALPKIASFHTGCLLIGWFVIVTATLIPAAISDGHIFSQDFYKHLQISTSNLIL